MIGTYAPWLDRLVALSCAQKASVGTVSAVSSLAEDLEGGAYLTAVVNYGRVQGRDRPERNCCECERIHAVYCVVDAEHAWILICCLDTYDRTTRQ